MLPGSGESSVWEVSGMPIASINPATGQAWTVADAHAALLARGYDDADATVFLQE